MDGLFELNALDMKILKEVGEIEFVTENDIQAGSRIIIKNVSEED